MGKEKMERIELLLDKGRELKQHMETFLHLAHRHEGSKEETEFLKAASKLQAEYISTFDEISRMKGN